MFQAEMPPPSERTEEESGRNHDPMVGRRDRLACVATAACAAAEPLEIGIGYLGHAGVKADIVAGRTAGRE